MGQICADDKWINNGSINTIKNNGVEIPEIDAFWHAYYRMLVKCIAWLCINCMQYSEISFLSEKEPFIIPRNYNCITYKYMIKDFMSTENAAYF